MNPILSAFAFSFALASSSWAAAPQVDTSTPKGTVKGVFDLSVVGDFEGIRQLFVTPANDKEKELLAEGFSDDLYIPALSTAVNEKFPDDRAPKPEPWHERAKAEIDKMVEKIDGDTATLSPQQAAGAEPRSSGPFQQPIIFKKQGGAWKMAITENTFLRLPPPQMKALHKARCDFMLESIRDVSAGKYATYEEFNKAMNQKQAELQKQHMPAP